MQKVSIIWWTRWFGKWIAEFILDKFDENVDLTITGRNIQKGSEVAQKLWCKFSDNNIESAKNADIVIISVPIAKTVEVIEVVAPVVKVWAILADVTSIKKTTSQSMQKYARKGVLVIPSHPMFGPFIKKIAGQIFVFTPKKDVFENTRYLFLKKFLEDNWANIIETTPEIHDKMMAVVQWLTHFLLFTMGESIRRLDFDVCMAQKFVSPVYKMLTWLVARWLKGVYT